MKKIILSIFFLLIFSSTISHAQTEWTIDSFHSDIEIENTGQINIKETINADFKDIQKHGIYRDIPYLYKNNDDEMYTEVIVGNILENGKEAKTQITKDGNNIRIRIGDPDKTINGKNIYEINYSVKGALLSYENHDELYWNITGNNWDASISSATASLYIPGDIIQKTDCFQGYLGSNEKCSNILNNNTAKFNSNRTLLPNEGITIVAAFDKGAIPIITLEKPKTFFEKILSLPIITIFLISLLAGFAAVFILWLKYGRDYWYGGLPEILNKTLKPKIMPLLSHETIVVEFTPPDNLPPAVLGVISDEYANTLDITSTIIDLAGKGYLTITEIPKKWVFGKVDYILTKTNKNRGKLLPFEKELLDRIFTKEEIKISELKTTFYKDLRKVKSKLYEEVVGKNYFPNNPESIRSKYLIFAILLLMLNILLIIVSVSSEILIIFPFAAAGIFTSLLLMIFSFFMSRKTAKGRDIYRRIKGYRMFIERAEKYRQRFFEDKNMFNEILPYAIVFGLTDKFAKAMKNIGIETKQPSWYHGVHAFNIVNFTKEVSTFSNSLSSAIASSPSSSGFSGGSSGGGFGGGGGGSW